LSRLPRYLPLIALAGVLGPVNGAQASTPIGVTTTSIQAPANVGRGAGALLQARLTVHGIPLAGRPVQFASRPVGSPRWHDLAEVETAHDGTATLAVRAVRRPTEYGVYSRGFAGLAASRMAATTVHVVDIRAAAPAQIRAGHAARLGGRLLLDGHGVSRQRLHFFFRPATARSWHDTRWARADHRGWARVSDKFHKSFEVGVRFEGADGLAPSPLAVQHVRVMQPKPKPKPKRAADPDFVFPFKDPAAADPQGYWSQDQGVDLGAHGQCGRAAVLVAVGDGVVIQEGIDGFGPTAPVIRMTSGVFAGRNVYYGHTGHNYVHVGDHVHAGDKVSMIGCGIVGQSQAPHLEIGVGVRGGPSCGPGWHQTSAEMYRQLVASDPRRASASASGEPSRASRSRCCRRAPAQPSRWLTARRHRRQRRRTRCARTAPTTPTTRMPRTGTAPPPRGCRTCTRRRTGGS
jgi:hypothetical protein